MLRYTAYNKLDFIGNFNESKELFTTVGELVASHKQLDVVDFDDHLTDVNLDFRNIFLNNISNNN